jgi:hypothetical protein
MIANTRSSRTRGEPDLASATSARAAPDAPDAPIELPPLGALQTTLRKLTESLATQLATPGTVAPDWSESEWLLARAVATVQGISPLLSRSLLLQGPPGWRRFLEDQRMHVLNRHARIRDLLNSLDDAARRAGIPLLALKGAALHELRIYEPGERPMADVDLLVREADMRGAGHILNGLGLHLRYAPSRHQVFTTDDPLSPTAFGENSSNGMKVELHSHIGEVLPLRQVDITASLFPSSPVPGLNPYPSRAALLLHLVLHAAGTMTLRSLRMIHLSDIARLSATMSDRDWDELLAMQAAADSTLWWAFPPLSMCARYYDSIPERVITATRLRCHWWLKQTYQRRALSDVSFSYLWVTAFPGMEWASSPGEMLKYALRRIAPDAKLRSNRKALAHIEVAAAQSAWTHMSQSRRILRWLTSRPVRPECLRPVRMALAQPR